MRGPTVILLLALSALAGCAEEAPERDSLTLADGSTLELGEGTSATLGAIAGVVVDDAIRPIPGAELATNDGQSATSDANGVFRLGNLEPGLYVLAVQAEGFLDARTSVEVVADETTTLKVQLLRDVRPQPYHVTFPYDAFMQAWGTVGQWAVEIVVPTPLCDCEYSVEPEGNVSGIVFEAFWDATTPDPLAQNEFYWEVSSPGLEWYEAGYCSNPCRAEPSMNGFLQDAPLTVRISGPDAWVAYQQQVKLFTTVFHNGAPPEDWSIQAPDG